MHDPDRLLLVGTVGRPHGVAGAVKVAPETDDPDRVARLPRVFVGETPETAAEHAVAGVRFQYPKGRTVVLLSLGGVGTREAADELRGLSVYADEGDLPPLAPGEVFVHDLVGFAVDEAGEDGAPTGRRLGVVRDLYDGAQLLFAVAPDGGGPDVLLPDVDEFVLETDVAGRRLLVRPPEGLFGGETATDRDDEADGGGPGSDPSGDPDAEG